MTEENLYHAVGRRKTAIARVRLTPGDGNITVNGKPFQEVFSRPFLQTLILQPFQVTNTPNRFNVAVKVTGGGISGQAGALCHGISRALVKFDQSFKPLLRKYGLITRDSRMKERKKYGLKRARKAPQYTKR